MYRNFKKVVLVAVGASALFVTASMAAVKPECLLRGGKVDLDTVAESALGIDLGNDNTKVRLESIEVDFPQQCFEKQVGDSLGLVCVASEPTDVP